MTLQLELPPQIEAWLAAEAQQSGLSPGDVALRVIEERAATLPARTVTPAPAIDAKNAAAIAWLDKRIAEEASDDPEEIRKADEEVAELKRNLNANRAATGERLVSL
jgi:hypothetical protein